MADQQQLNLLQQGATDWNRWRIQYPDIRPNLSEANLSEANLSEANLSEAKLGGADLSGANLSEADLYRANLNEANLSEADLYRANLNEANLSEANLSGANLSGANLSEAFLYRANLNEANLSEADLYRAYLYRANLSGANLSRANLNRVDLSEANLSEATVRETNFGNVDLRTVRGLETVNHWGPSTIGTDTLLRSEGDIPETFLRKAGLSDAFITYTRSLVQNPIEYYTCFISYSTKDQDFAERLYTDLQSKGVRCWFAPEDMKTGDKIRHRIDESIRAYDKLLVILSQHSVESSWVEYEVNKALKKEQEQGKPVLFPIKLDETIMETPEAWAAAIRKKRHLGDFTKWKEHDAYQKGLKRLMRDLQPDHPPTSKP